MSRTQGGRQHLFGVRREGAAIHRAHDRHRRTDALRREGRQQGDVGTMVTRDPSYRPLPAWGPCAAAGQPRVGAGFVDEDEVTRVERGDIGAPRCAGCFVALGGEERRFLSGQPIRCSARDIVAGLRRTPVAVAHVAQCSASVASGVARTWAISATSASGPTRRGRPGRGVAATEPVSCRRRRHRLIVLTPTPKSRAASAWGRPASMAPSSRSRRSAEYCFTAAASHRPNSSAPRSRQPGSPRPGSRSSGTPRAVTSRRVGVRDSAAELHWHP